jgi:hypothetical protein
LALDSSSDIILADMGAGSGTVTYRWFADIYPELSNASVKLTSIGVVTADPGSVESILTWSAHLRTDVDYLIVLNELDQEGETFRYWHESSKQSHSPTLSSLSSLRWLPAALIWNKRREIMV